MATVATTPLASWLMIAKDATIAQYGGIFQLAIWHDPAGLGLYSDYTDTAVSVAQAYTTQYQSAALDFDAPDIEKHLRDVQVDIYSDAGTVTVLVEGQTVADIRANTWTTIQSWASETLPFVGHFSVHAPVIRTRVTVTGDGSLVIESIHVSWKPVRWRS